MNMNEDTIISILNYSELEFTEKTIPNSTCSNYKGLPGVTWIDVKGLGNKENIAKLCDCYGLHPLVRESLEEGSKRPKIEDHGEYNYIVLSTLEYDEDKDSVAAESIHMILGQTFVITFRSSNTTNHILEPVKKRIRSSGSKLRKLSSDYLAYRIIDAMVDNYFTILEWFGERLELLEDEVLNMGDKGTIVYIQKQRREMLFMRETLWPLRTVLNSLQRGESALIKPETKVFMRDAYDHTTQVIENLESFRDMMSSMIEIYVSNISNKLNEVMKILTIISTIFIPLTFIVGLYGMNFRYMPEIEWRYGYFFTWSIMLIVVAIMMLYFKKKRWF